MCTSHAAWDRARAFKHHWLDITKVSLTFIMTKWVHTTCNVHTCNRHVTETKKLMKWCWPFLYIMHSDIFYFLRFHFKNWWISQSPEGLSCIHLKTRIQKTKPTLGFLVDVGLNPRSTTYFGQLTLETLVSPTVKWESKQNLPKVIFVGLSEDK